MMSKGDTLPLSGAGAPSWRDIWHAHRSTLRCFDLRVLTAVVTAGGLAGLIPIVAGAVMAAVSKGMTVTTVVVPLSLLIIAFVVIGVCLAFALRWAYRSASVFEGDRYAAAWGGLGAHAEDAETASHRGEAVSRIFGHEFAQLGWAGEGLRLLYGTCLTIFTIVLLTWLDWVLGAAALLAAVFCITLCLVMTCRRVEVLDRVRLARSRVTRRLIEYLSVFLRLETTGAKGPALAGLRDLMSREASARARASRMSVVMQAMPLVAAAGLAFLAFRAAMPTDGQSDGAMFVLLVLAIANLTIGLLCIAQGLQGVSTFTRRLLSSGTCRSDLGSGLAKQSPLDGAVGPGLPVQRFLSGPTPVTAGSAVD